MSEPEQDIAATAGLRRIVAHARDMLRATQLRLPAGDWAYGKHWTPAQVQRHTAHLFAEQALTLVLDCLPQATVVSADEVADLRADYDRQLAESRQSAEERERELVNVRADRDEALRQQEEAEAAEVDAVDRWETAANLAKVDAAKAVRYLLDPDAGDVAP